MALPWFMEHNARETLSKRKCPAELQPFVEQFLDKGYAIIPNSLPGDMCDAVVARFRAFERANEDKLAPYRLADGHYPRLINLHLAIPELFDTFSMNAKGLALQDFLFGAETCLYTSLFYERGSAQPIHRDTPYFCTRPEYQYFGMWVALEDVDEDNGPLMAMEGGHMLGEIDRVSVARDTLGDRPPPPDSPELWDAYQKKVTLKGETLGLKVATLPVSKGTTILWHPQLPHGGAPIRDIARTRFSFVMHTTPVGMPVYHAQAFFQPEKAFPERAPWSYATKNRRKYAQHPRVSFGHQKEYAPAELA